MVPEMRRRRANTVPKTSNKADPSLRSEIEETGRESGNIENHAMNAEASASSAALVLALISMQGS